MRGAKYRLRTAIREHLPWALVGLAPKGRDDCGDHEWYQESEDTWRCYHCTVGVTDEIPWTAAELRARELEAEAMRVRVGLREYDPVA